MQWHSNQIYADLLLGNKELIHVSDHIQLLALIVRFVKISTDCTTNYFAQISGRRCRVHDITVTRVKL